MLMCMCVCCIDVDSCLNRRCDPEGVFKSIQLCVINLERKLILIR